MWEGGGKTISRCGSPLPQRNGRSNQINNTPIRSSATRVITWVVCKENEFKGDYCDSLVIGAKTFST